MDGVINNGNDEIDGLGHALILVMAVGAFQTVGHAKEVKSPKQMIILGN
jgi:hypothetical protein